jgi:hypothetical protein
MIEADFTRKDDTTSILILLEKGFKFSHDNEVVAFFTREKEEESDVNQLLKRISK